MTRSGRWPRRTAPSTAGPAGRSGCRWRGPGSSPSSAGLQVEQLSVGVFGGGLPHPGKVGGELDGGGLARTDRLFQVEAVHVDLVGLVALDLDTHTVASGDPAPTLGGLALAARHPHLDQLAREPRGGGRGVTGRGGRGRRRRGGGGRGG